MASTENPLDALRSSSEDHELFAPFYRAYFEPILGFIARRVHDPEVAVDLTAESFAQAFLHRGRFRGTSRQEMESWIYRIAEHQLTHFFRKGKSRTKAMEKLQIERPVLEQNRRDAIEELAETDELRAVLRAGLAQISEVQRQAIGMRVLEDMRYEEIADHLRITEAAARARVSRALRALANSLEQNPNAKETT